MNKKVSVIIVLILLLAIGGYFTWQKNHAPKIYVNNNIPPNTVCAAVITRAKNSQTGEVKDFNNSCIPDGWERVEPVSADPVIYSVIPSSGPVGTKITIKGKNLNGFEGDLNARIATEFNTADYSSGIMHGERNGSTDTIVTTIESSFCKQDTSYSGLPCKSYFYVTPGLYEISVKPWGKESNSVSFTVTK